MRARRTSDEREREVDLRLAVGAVAGWAAVLIVLLSGATALVATITAAGCVLASLTGLLVSARCRAEWARRLRVAALVVGCVTVVLLPLAGALRQVQDGPIAALASRRATVVVDAVVAGDPRRLRSTIAAAASRVSLDVSVRAVRSGPQLYRVRVRAVVLAPADGWQTLVPGQPIRLDGRMAPPQRTGGLVVAIISARGQPELRGRPPWWQRAATTVRLDLRRAAAGLPAPESGLLPGLVDGDISELDPVVADHFRTAGLTHLVAVSGTNAAIVVGAVLLVLRRLGTRRWLCAAIGGLTLVAFVVVARPSPSVVRAAAMAGVVLVALALGRPRQGVPGLSFAALALLAWRPEWAVDAGFSMSVLATAALLVVAPGWAAALRRRHVPAVLAEGIAVAAAASLVTAPIAVLLSGQVSLVALPANVIAELAVVPATVLGVLAAALAPLSLPAGSFFAQLAGWPCRWLVGTAEFFGARDGATLRWPGTPAGALVLAVVSVGLVLALRSSRSRAAVGAGLVTLLVLQLTPVPSLQKTWPVADALLVACDVGQGDALVIPAAEGTAVVIDSGPEPVAIDRCLRSLGVRRVAVYVQSHFDLDHVGGIAGALRGRGVGLVLTGPLQLPAFGRSTMDRALAPIGLRSQIAPTGAVITAGRVRLDVLASRVVTVDGEPDSNNSSLIVRATVAGRRVLLLGDAAVESQQDLVERDIDVRADILKVAHHGSAYFDPDLYARVRAELAVISVGANNPYGHPSARVLSTLSRLAVPVARTDRDGDIAVVAGTGDDLRIVVHHPAATRSAPAVSPVHARMESWQNTPVPMRVASEVAPASSLIRASSSSSATRSFSLIAPSSRSPPPAVERIPRATSSPSMGTPWSPPSSTNCSARRCSAARRRSSFAPRKTSRRQ
jgi:competence protein ComEC